MSSANLQNRKSHQTLHLALNSVVIAAIITTFGSIILTRMPELLLQIGLTGPLTTDPCVSAKLVSPSANPNRADAARFSVTNIAQIGWNKPDCIMTIEINQNNEMKSKLTGMKNGASIKLGDPSSGETEIKLWREGQTIPSDSVWVSIK